MYDSQKVFNINYKLQLKSDTNIVLFNFIMYSKENIFNFYHVNIKPNGKIWSDAKRLDIKILLNTCITAEDIKMYLFLVIATFSDLLLYGLLKQLNVCEKNKKISKIIPHPLFFHHHHKKQFIQNYEWRVDRIINHKKQK